MSDNNNNVMLESSKYAEAIESIVSKQPTGYDVVEVSFSVKSAVLLAYLNAQYDLFESTVNTSGGSVSFSRDEWIAYCATIISSRIGWVTNSGQVVHPRDNIRISAYLSITLGSIGRVEVADKGLTLTPKFDDGGIKLLSMKEMRQISSKLAYFEGKGFTFSEGYLIEKSGSMQVMSMQTVENLVLSQNTDAHPIHSVIAATFAVQGLATVLGEQSFRVTYVDVNNVAAQVVQFAEPRVIQ